MQIYLSEYERFMEIFNNKFSFNFLFFIAKELNIINFIKSVAFIKILLELTDITLLLILLYLYTFEHSNIFHVLDLVLISSSVGGINMRAS